jgi:hypothetical protein
MRRTYISPEFNYSRINGTFNMLEESTPFGSKMLEIEDSIVISDSSLVYFQSSNGEQLDLDIETTLPSISYSESEDLRLNHTLQIDNNQSNSKRDTTTQYILNIDLETILKNYLFATLKRWRTFEGVRNSMVRSGDVDFAIKEYITKNVLDRYKLERVELYLNYVSINGQNVLRFDNLWAGTTSQYRSAILPNNILNDSFKLRGFQSETEFDFSSTKITFSQERKSTDFCFDYYFKLFFQKI